MENKHIRYLGYLDGPEVWRLANHGEIWVSDPMSGIRRNKRNGTWLVAHVKGGICVWLERVGDPYGEYWVKIQRVI